MRKRNDFLSVKADGVVLKGRYMVVQILNAPDFKTKLGIITSKRYHKSAVKRNYAKRLIRESFRQIKNEFDTPIWSVIIARKMMLDGSLDAIKLELTNLFVKANVIQKNTNMA